jgi:restriction system protein
MTGGKFVVQTKKYTRDVQPTYVRDLWETAPHKGAIKGIMIATSGYGPDNYKVRRREAAESHRRQRPLALCQQYEIPAPHPQSRQRKAHRVNRLPRAGLPSATTT